MHNRGTTRLCTTSAAPWTGPAMILKTNTLRTGKQLKMSEDGNMMDREPLVIRGAAVAFVQAVLTAVVLKSTIPSR